jgi:hypothetical protein
MANGSESKKQPTLAQKAGCSEGVDASHKSGKECPEDESIPGPHAQTESVLRSSEEFQYFLILGEPWLRFFAHLLVGRSWALAFSDERAHVTTGIHG